MTAVSTSARQAETLLMIRDHGPVTWGGARRVRAEIGSTMSAATLERMMSTLKDRGLIERTDADYAVTALGREVAAAIDAKTAGAVRSKAAAKARVPFPTYVKRSDREGNPMRPVTLPFVSILGEGARI